MKRLLVFLSVFFAAAASSLAGDNPRTVTAVRITTPPRIDGILDDAVWKQATSATDFIQRDPEEGRPASERSEIRVLYDDEALYFGCTFYDSEPEKIVARLTRRDDEIESDEASIRIDSYHDHQTGYEFTFNAAGVKIDKLQYDDANREDDSWDPVWDLQTSITSEGWTAEVKIPFRILRYRNAGTDTADNTWGINFLRYISRKQESERWAFTPKSQSGFISRYGHLVGLRRLPDPQPFELLPFVTSKQSYDPATVFQDRREKFRGNAGLDLKYGLSSNFTIDATFNPDFGQVEADPTVLNLSTFETFYPEKRPFFIEGTQIIRFTTFGGDFGPGMFYSRRIGRAIKPDEVSVPDGGHILDVPQNVTILGAAKISGKTNDGLSIGVLQAFTEEEKAIVVDSTRQKSEQVLEPLAHYSILRLKKDFLNNSNVGMILTSTVKDTRYPAFTNGYDWTLNFDQNIYSLNGFLALSHTTNAANERITGSAGKIQFARIAAEHWLWSLSADYTSPKYYINDVGFFFSPDDFGSVASLTYKEDVPAAVVRNYTVGGFFHTRFNFEGANIARQLHMNGSLLFANYWSMTASADADIGLYDQYESRGNGLYRKPTGYQMSTYVFTDPRNEIIFKLGQRFAFDDRRKRGAATEFGVTTKPFSWMEWDFNAEYQRVRDQEAWAASENGFAIFGDRSTDQYDFIVRGTLTFLRDLTLQFYGQVFLAKGHYENFRRLVSPSEFIPEAYAGEPDFNKQSLNGNLVLRWEYLPGSTLYLVWSQARGDRKGNYFTSFGDDFKDTFRSSPSNVFLLKVNYWLNF
ncbi:MAG: carbohydrate binding family 9 domain-containing protein [Ignavibacteriae bacterium]|nr:carbohydrate binding family 9 domain-containing protein [Ignavibacteria bacterium]MBI3364056.1 carbohydrate binding family 9 domain-containing protein [Ignavibacteriota bacterium]